MTRKIELRHLLMQGREHIGLEFTYDEILIEQCRKLFARWSPAHRLWHLPYSESNYRQIRVHFHGLAQIRTADFDLTHKNYLESRKIKGNQKNAALTSLSKFARQELLDVDRYLEMRRYAKRTRETYGYLLHVFFATIEYQRFDQLTHRVVDAYNTDHVVRAGYSVSYQRQFIGALKIYLKVRPRVSIIPENLERPDRQKRLPTVLSEEEVMRLIGQIPQIKHRTIVATLYATGMRISEVLALRLRDIDFHRNMIHIVQSKGGKDRVIGLSESLKILLANYMRDHHPQIYLFNGQGGGPYSGSSVRQIIHRAARRAGITKKVTPHTMRHSYATHLLDQGVDVRHVQELLGHSKPETTMIYTHVSTKKLMQIRSPFDAALERFQHQQNPDGLSNRIPFPGLIPPEQSK